MVNIEKINACKTPRMLPVSNQKVVQSLLNTPTLKRRSPLSSFTDIPLGIGHGTKFPKTDLTSGIEKIAEDKNSESSGSDEESKPKKQSMLPIIPEQKLQQSKPSMIPIVPLNKLEQQPSQPQSNPQNPLLLYSQKSILPVEKPPSQVPSLKQMPIFNAGPDSKPVANPTKNVNFTLNTLKGLESAKTSKLSTFNDSVKEPTVVKSMIDVKEESKEGPVIEKVVKNEEVVKEEPKPPAITIQPPPQKQAATAIRSILKMSEFGGNAKPTQPSAFGLMQPIQRKEETPALIQPLPLKLAEEKKVEDKSIVQQEILFQQKVQEEAKISETNNIQMGGMIMPQPLKKAPVNTLSKLASSLRSFDKPTIAPLQVPSIPQQKFVEEAKSSDQSDVNPSTDQKQLPFEHKQNAESPDNQSSSNIFQPLIRPIIPIINMPTSMQPVKNTLTGKIENDEQQQKESNYATTNVKNPFSNALGFFKAQKNEEKKTIKNEDNKFVVAFKESDEAQTQDVKGPSQIAKIPQTNISQIQLPQSPYLQNVRRKFEAPIKTALNPAYEEQKDQMTEKKLFSTAGPSILPPQVKSQQHQAMTSPYIGLNVTKEQRMQNFQNLKKHVQNVINRGTAIEEMKKTKSIKETLKIAPISNAFSLEIKNEREEALKNMEHLRQSVKLKKRANPLEKIMNKLIGNDRESMIPLDIPKTPLISEDKRTLEHNDNSLIKKSKASATGQLQKIDEAQDEDGTTAAKKIDDEEVVQEFIKKPMEPPRKANVMKIGMSPIITFRALNRMALNNSTSQQDSQFSTPVLTAEKIAHDSNSSMSSHKNHIWMEEESKIEEVIKILQSAKQELDVLENLKTLSLEIFNMINQVSSSKQKKQLLEKYLVQLDIVGQQVDLLGKNSSSLLQQFIGLVKQQIEAIDQLDIIEKKYKRTLPWVRQSDLEDSSLHAQKRMNMSIQTREAPSQLMSSQGGLQRGFQNNSQLFSPLPFSSRPLNFQGMDLNSLGLTPRSSQQKFPISQTPMISSRNIRDLPQISLSKGGDNQSHNSPSNFQTSFMRLQQMANPKGLLAPQSNFSQEFPDAKGCDFKQQKFSGFNGQAPRQKSQFSTQNTKKQPSLSSQCGLSSIGKEETAGSPKEPHSSSSSFYSSNSEENKVQTEFLKSPGCSKKSLFSKPSQAQQEPPLESNIEKPNVDHALQQLKLFQSKPPRIPRSISRNQTTKNALQIKSKTFDAKFFDKAKSVVRGMEEIKEEDPDFQPTLNDKMESQSDIVIGQYLQNGDSLMYDEDDERKTNSDIHEMFFVYELLKDDLKFEKLLEKKSESSSPKEMTSNDCESDEEEEILTMGRVRFSSLCILPSQLECCSIDYSEKQKITPQVSINDFILIKALSSGAYGKVILARKKNTDDFFAIKVLDKQKMMEKNVVEYVINEKNILSQMSNEFIVRGVYTFQSKKFLYMVMEFMKGGDFSSLLEQVGSFDEDTAKYYLAQIVLALEYLHSKGVIHRDLKPDNILIDSEGRIKLTDFGLSEAGLEKIKANASQKQQQPNKQGSIKMEVAKSSSMIEQKELQEDIEKVLGHDKSSLKRTQNNDKLITKQQSIEENKDDDNKKAPSNESNKEKAKSEKKENRALGTCHYMAPEVINGEENTHSLDFWSLGVIVYEFLTGGLPFQADTPLEVFERIKKRDIKFPPIGRGENEMTPEAHSLIEALLTMDPKQRLGTQSINEIKSHPFFKGIVWDKIMELNAPFKPMGRDQDTQYFPKANAEDEDIQTILNDRQSILEKQENKEFNRFDNVCYDTLQNINSKEASKAMIRAERMRKRQMQVQKQPSKNIVLMNESILFSPTQPTENKTQSK